MLRIVGRPGPAPSGHSNRVLVSSCPSRSLYAPLMPPCPTGPPGPRSRSPGPLSPPGPFSTARSLSSDIPGPRAPRAAAHAPPHRSSERPAGSASPAAPDYSSHGAARPRPAPPGGHGGPDGVGRDERGSRDTTESPGSGGARRTRWSPADPRLSGLSSARLGSGRRRTPPFPGPGPQQPRALHLSPHCARGARPLPAHRG